MALCACGHLEWLRELSDRHHGKLRALSAADGRLRGTRSGEWPCINQRRMRQQQSGCQLRSVSQSVKCGRYLRCCPASHSLRRARIPLSTPLASGNAALFGVILEVAPIAGSCRARPVCQCYCALACSVAAVAMSGQLWQGCKSAQSECSMWSVPVAVARRRAKRVGAMSGGCWQRYVWCCVAGYARQGGGGGGVVTDNFVGQPLVCFSYVCSPCARRPCAQQSKSGRVASDDAETQASADASACGDVCEPEFASCS